jgi:hypothetical protein
MNNRIFSLIPLLTVVGLTTLGVYDYKQMILQEQNKQKSNFKSNTPINVTTSQFITFDQNSKIDGLFKIIDRSDSIFLDSKNPVNELYTKLSSKDRYYLPSFFKCAIINNFMSQTRYNLITNLKSDDYITNNIKAAKSLNWRKHGWNYIIVGKSEHFKILEYMCLQIKNPVHIQSNKIYDNTHHQEPEKYTQLDID